MCVGRVSGLRRGAGWFWGVKGAAVPASPHTAVVQSALKGVTRPEVSHLHREFPSPEVSHFHQCPTSRGVSLFQRGFVHGSVLAAITQGLAALTV